MSFSFYVQFKFIFVPRSNESNYMLLKLRRVLLLGEIAVPYYIDASADVINVTACHNEPSVARSIKLEDLNLTFCYFISIEFVATFSYSNVNCVTDHFKLCHNFSMKRDVSCLFSENLSKDSSSRNGKINIFIKIIT